MFRVERSFFSLSWPRGDDAVPAVPLGNDDNQDAICTRRAERDSTLLAVSQHSGGVQRIVLYYLFRLFRRHAVTGDVLNVGCVSIEVHQSIQIVYTSLVQRQWPAPNKATPTNVEDGELKSWFPPIARDKNAMDGAPEHPTPF